METCEAGQDEPGGGEKFGRWREAKPAKQVKTNRAAGRKNLGLALMSVITDNRPPDQLSRCRMTKLRDEVLLANQKYVERFGDKAKLALPPARGFAILTCMDARIDPAKLAGLAEGDAHVIRNAGGRASDDAIRSLVISHKLLGTNEWFVIHHSNCGMELFTDEVIRDLLARSLATASFDGTRWSDPGGGDGSRAGDFIDWLTIANQADSVAIDVERIRQHPLVPRSIPIHGFLYEVTSGRLIEVPQAQAIGRPRA
jgi:carbonic anhydrase